MAKDARALREEAAEATAAGKHKKALAAYLELERLEARDAQWAKRAGETYRRLGNMKNAIEAFERSVDRYAQNGFLVQAIAVCKIILQMDPQHAGTLGRLARMNEQVGQGPTRAQGYADNNPALQGDPRVVALRQGTTGAHAAIPGTRPPPFAPQQLEPIRERKKLTTPPPIAPLFEIATARTKSKPINLPPGAALEEITLAQQVETAINSSPGVHVIPIDDEPYLELADEVPHEGTSTPAIEIELADPVEIEPEVHDVDELELEDLEEIPLAEPRVIGQVAQRALAATPLFAGLPKAALEALVANLTLVTLEEGTVLFQEGDVGDALYVIVEGEVSVQAEGPPRVEMARLGPGAFLGEVALMTDQPRSATVSATVPSELLRIDRHTLSAVLADHGDVLRAVLRFVRDRLVDRWMRTSPLFRPFTEGQRRELASRFRFLEIEPHTKLLSAGQRPDGLYIVLAGHYLVQRGGANVGQLGPGDLIGETALLSGSALKSDVIADGKSLALCLPAAEFREMIMTHPHVLEYVGEQAEQSRRLEIL
ncbi:MAG: cyclic nucleotide-binding domain-containing protein [Kofleriaceae bacterium]|nr:cyclic nucleotide-binding domain-containing protein [Kofleriaceae bacterium]